MQTDATARLTADDTTRLIEFARACKAAARAVLLYPNGHPAIATTLGRIVHLTSAAAMPTPMRLTVLGDGLKLQDKAPARSDAAIGELAVLLHSHLVGELVVRPNGDLDAWRTFLLLLGRAPEDVRVEGGIARLWGTLAGRHVDIREIDYAEVLRERFGAATPGWSDLIAYCLRGEGGVLSEEARQLLLDAGSDVEKLTALVTALDEETLDAGGKPGQRAAALVRLLDRIVATVSDTAPDRVDGVLDNLAHALGQLSPTLMADLLTDVGTITETPDLVHTIVDHMSDSTIATFVARHALVPGTAVERLATAFQSLVPEDRRERLLSLARDEAARQHESDTDFGSMWESVAEKLMLSYSDEAYVSEQYGRELSSAKTTALAVEHLSDDPPERMAAWLGTVAASELRRLDLALVHDLLRLDHDPEQRANLMRPVVALIEDLLLVGDFEPADTLIRALVEQAQGSGPNRQPATNALEGLAAGALLRNVSSHLPMVDQPTFDQIKAMLLSLGDTLVRPLAEALVEETAPRVRERLAAVLIAFGSRGRSEVERLKASSNPVVRRTAIHLLREFGGNEALPELSDLLSDRESQVQRDAVRAILAIGTDAAYRVLSDALIAGTSAQRDAIITSMTGARDERAVSVFAYVLDHVDHTGPQADLYMRAIHALGAMRHNDGVDAIARALHRGEWWAPRRTAAFRAAAAAALARIGTQDAVRALEDAMANGSRGVRSAARLHLAAVSTPRREVA